MPATRKKACSQWTEGSSAKRLNHAQVDTQDATSFSHTSSSSSSSAVAGSSSDWAQLPAELLSLIVGYASFRSVLRLALMNRRLHQLVLQPDALASHGVNLWSHYPPVTFALYEAVNGRQVRERVLRVNGERFGCTRRSIEYVSSLLSVLRHTRQLQLVLDSNRVSTELPAALLSSLGSFQQLQTLAVRRDAERVPSNLLAPALRALSSLTSLELNCHDTYGEHDLTPALRHLCTLRLRHVGLYFRHLRYMFEHQPRAPMPRLQSLTIHRSLYLPREHRYAGEPVQAQDDESWAEQLPSLMHLTVNDDCYLPRLATSHPPHLSSLTVHGSVDVDLSHITTRAFCLRPFWNGKYRSSELDTLRAGMLLRAPRMQQLAVFDTRHASRGRPRTSTVFPLLSAAPSSLSQLVHLEFVEGLTLADLRYLLSPSSPPVFTAQLTHLALRVHWQDRAAAAALVSSLPSMYPSLTHVHVDVEGKLNNRPLDECAEWDAAVRMVRTAVGSAWCDGVEDVIACREDVVWRCSMDQLSQA